MPLASAELAQAREIAARLFDELKLEAYLFEVEPEEQTWKLRLECAFESGWTSLCIPIEKRELLAGRDDPQAFNALVEKIRGKVTACKVG